MWPIVSSATEIADAIGVFRTGIFLSPARATSMLSTPTPPRAMTFSFVPASITSRVTFVADRTMMQSNSPMRRTSSSGFMLCWVTV
jgi:hypothetical protein